MTSTTDMLNALAKDVADRGNDIIQELLDCPWPAMPESGTDATIKGVIACARTGEKLGCSGNAISVDHLPAALDAAALFAKLYAERWAHAEKMLRTAADRR